MKRAALLGFSALLLLAGAVVVLPTFLDWNKYSGAITGMLQEATGRDISVGALSFHLLPQPTLRAADVRVANVPEGVHPDFARLQALDIRFAFMPLLTGNVRIESIGLVGPRVYLESFEDGGNNWTFASGTGDGSSNVSIDRLSVEGGAVDYLAAGGAAYRLTDIEGDLAAERLTGPLRGQATFRYGDVPMAVDIQAGDFADAGRAASFVAVLKLPAADAEARMSGSVVPESSAFNAMVNIAGPNLESLAREVARIEGVPELPGLPAVPYGLSFSASRSGDTISSNNLLITIDGEEVTGSAGARLAAVPSAELHLSASRFNLNKLIAGLPDRPPARTEGGEAAFSMPEGLTFTFDLGINAVDYRGGIIRQVRVAGHLENGSLMISPAAALLPGAAEVSLSGRLSASGGEPAFVGQVSANAGNARAFFQWAGVDVSTVPAGQLGQLRLSTPLVMEGSRVRLAGLEAALDRSNLTGNLSADLGEVTDIRADLALNRLDLDAYLPERDEGEEAEPLSLEMLTRFRGEVNARIDRLSHQDRLASDIVVQAALDGEALTLRRLEVGRMADATLAASGSITNLAGEPTADLTLDVEGQSATRFLSMLGYEPEGAPLSLGRFSLRTAYQGTMGAGNATAEGNIGGTALSLTARLRETRTQPGAVATLDLRNPSLADLARQLGHPLAQPQHGAMPVEVSARLDGSARQGTLDARATLDGGSISLTGNYAESTAGATYRLEAAAEHENPVPLLQALGLPYEPAGPISTAQLAATVIGEPGVTRFESLRFALGDARLGGSVTLDDRGERLLLTAQLEGDDIDLNAFLPPSATGVAQVQAVDDGSAAAKARARWSREPIDWSPVRDTDMNIRVTAKSITYGPYAFTSPSLRVTAQDGVLSLEPLAAGLFDGTATIRLTADATATPPALDIETELKDVDVARLSTASMGNSFATGRLGLTGRFTASGNSQFEMISNLSGSGQLAARNGVIRKVDLPALTERLNALRTMNDFLATARSALSGGETPYRQVGGEVVVEKGVVRTRNVTSDIDATSADLTATADLPNWTLDALASFSLTGVPGAPPVSVALKGPIDDPARTLGTSQLQNFFVSRLGAAVLREAIGQQGGGLGELLGGGPPQTEESQQEGAPQQRPALQPLQRLLDRLGGDE